MLHNCRWSLASSTALVADRNIKWGEEGHVYVILMCLTYFSEINSAFLIQLSSTACIAGEFCVPTEMSVILLLQNILVWGLVQNVMRFPPPPPDTVISLLFLQYFQDHWKECEQRETTRLIYKKHGWRSFSSQIEGSISCAQQLQSRFEGRIVPSGDPWERLFCT